MDRQLLYPGQILPETSLLNMAKDSMIGLSKLAAGVFGTAGFINGLTVSPNAPAALNVVVSPGEFYSLLNLDGTAYSSLAADTAHAVLKQGIVLDAVTLATPAPVTAGQSVVFLIQASVSESDTTPVVLPYYNASNPAQAYSGPANAGTTNNTKRQCIVTLQAKAGIAAVTGSQTTPAPDAGFTGLYAVTVANGQATVVAGNIAVLASAPYLGNAALLNQANVFTQFQTMPTPAVSDNSNKLATTAFVAAAQKGFTNFQVFTVNGNFTVPAGITKVMVEAWGGGGGGGGASVVGASGGGGGGGGYGRGIFAVTPAQAIAVTIGTGGAAATGGTLPGSNGNSTSFGALLTANGGGAGGAYVGSPFGGGGGTVAGGNIGAFSPSGSCGVYASTGGAATGGTGGGPNPGYGGAGDGSANHGAGAAAGGMGSGGGGAGSSATTIGVAAAGGAGQVIVYWQ